MSPSDATASIARNPPQLPGNPGKLNVILHGLFTVVQDDQAKEITAYIPNMGSEHLYKAGNWLAETTLAQPAEFKLEGVTGGAEKFSPEFNIILHDVHVGEANCCDRIYATLRLPYPKYPIQSLGRLRIQADAIGGDSTDKIVGFANAPILTSASVHVLTYDFPSDTDLRLGDHPWEPVLDDGFVNLHIFSEPERTPEQDHLRHAFQMSMGLFVGVDLSLRRPMLPADLEAEKKDIPQGVHPLELRGLVHRLRVQQVLGRAIKEHRDLNGILDEPTAFDGDPGTCPSGGIT